MPIDHGKDRLDELSSALPSKLYGLHRHCDVRARRHCDISRFSTAGTAAFARSVRRAFFRLIDVSPTAELHRLAAVFSTHEATARSLAFAAVAVSALCMTGLFLRSLAARSEVRGLPASIGIAG